MDLGVQSVKCRPCKNKNLSPQNLNFKEPSAVSQACNPSVRKHRRVDPWACWPASVSSRSAREPVWSKEMVDGRQWTVTEVVLWPPHILLYTCAPAYPDSMHMHAHAQTHTHANRHKWWCHSGVLTTSGWRRKPSQEWLPLGVNPHSPGSSVCWHQLSFPLKQLAADTDETPTQHTLGRVLCHTQQIRKEGESGELPTYLLFATVVEVEGIVRRRTLVDGLLEWAPVFLLCDRGPPLCSHVKT